MKNIVQLLLALLMAAVLSCTKTNPVDQKIDKTLGIPVTFEVGAPEIEEIDTKMTHSVEGTTHKALWEIGDQISMFAFDVPSAAGESSTGKIVNFSDRAFTATADGTTTPFSGYVPSEINDLTGSGTGNVLINLFAVYPATTMTVGATSGSNYWKITGFTIPDTQDGTGWKYCYYFAHEGRYSKSYGTIKAGTPKFRMGTTLLKLKLDSSKPVKTITVKQETATAPYLCGTFTIYSNVKWIMEGCSNPVVTIQDGDNTLPDDILVCVREIRKDREVSFTFTANDGTTIVKKLKAQAAYDNGKVFNLGTVTLNNWSN